MSVRAIIISSILCILMLVLGLFSGIWWQNQKNLTIVPEQMMPESIKLLSSNIVSSIVASGKVTGINNKSITLTFKSESKVIKIAEDVKVYEYVNVDTLKPTDNERYVSKPMAFGDIKIGDSLQINMRVLPDGQIEGFEIVILPMPTPSSK